MGIFFSHCNPIFVTFIDIQNVRIMENETLLVHQMTGERLINTIRLMVDDSIKRELAPLKRMLVALEGATIERKEAAEILGVAATTISNYVVCGKLSPVFVEGSSHMKYNLSEVLALKKV